MRIKKHPPPKGFSWIKEGIEIFMKNPRKIVIVNIIYIIAFFFISQIPAYGKVASLLLAPFSTLFMLDAILQIHSTSQIKLEKSLLIFTHPSSRRTLFHLGILNTVYTLFAFWIATVSTGSGEAWNFVTGSVNRQNMTDAPILIKEILILGFIFIPFQTVMLYSPAFAYWHNASMVKSLFYSAIAIVRNINAFLVYTIIWTGLIMFFGIFMLLIGAMLTSVFLREALTATVEILIFCVLHCSMLATYESLVIKENKTA